MPTIITHGLIGLALAAKARNIQAATRRSLLIAAILCAILPDIDYLGFKMGIQYNSLFGHRGITHSFFFAFLVSIATGYFLERKFRCGMHFFCKISAFVFLAMASHSLLDAMTDGGEGVAFFSPFSNHRYFFSYRPIMVSPLGIEGFFVSWRGPLVLATEILLLVLPLGIILYPGAIWRKMKTHQRITAAVVAIWATAILLIMGLSPLNNIHMTIGGSSQPVVDLYTKQYGNPYVLESIPTWGIRDGRLLRNFEQFQKLGLFNRMIETENYASHWASGFFPSWFGGIAGRWRDSDLALMVRTIFGFGVPGAQEILEVLKESQRSPTKKDYLFQLSPTEKYDLALGNYDFPATKSILAQTHNAAQWPKFWYGICNGMAAASKWYEEPFRAVDVVNPNGFKIRFHPNDVKALLGYSLANAAQWTELGTRCNVNGPEARGCRLNAGAFFLATMNRIALARDGFIVDGFSGTRKQFYLFDAVRVEVLQQPDLVEKWNSWAFPTPVKQVAKVRFTMELVSTLIGDKAGDSIEEKEKGDGFFKKVGRIASTKVLEAMIAIDKQGDVIGGSWLGNEDIPDVIFFPSAVPAMDGQGRLKENGALSWLIIKDIYLQSISNVRNRSLIDLSL